MRDNHIYEYHAKIQSGEIVAGEKIKAVYSMLVQGLESGEYFFDADCADFAIEFVEHFCHHSQGRNDLLKLELWQKALVSAMFGIVDADGLRVFREVFVVVARKNGKTLFAAAVIAFMAYMDGEYGAEIYCLAPKLRQANQVFKAFHEMIKKKETLNNKARKRLSDIYIEKTNSSIEPIAFNSKKSDGFNPHLVVNDELAAWAGMNGLRQYGVMESALGARRQPIIFSISTAGYENDSIYDELYQRADRLLKGGSREKRLLPIIYEIDDVEKWNDIEELKKSNPNLGVSVPEEFYHNEIAKAEKSLASKAEFMTKFCNVKQNACTAWLDQLTVKRSGEGGKGYKLADFAGSYCVGGVDLSQSTDLTAASVTIERGGKLHTFCQFFMPANKVDELQARDGVVYSIFVKRGIIQISGENKINYNDVYDWFMKMRLEYDLYILKIGYDRYMAHYLVDQLSQSGFHMDDVRQGDNLTPVMREFEGILKDGDFYIVENPLLEAHFLNVGAKQDSETRKIQPVKIEQRAKIDGFVSVICAMTVRQKYYNEIGEYLQNTD